ncbi:MAG TPA: metallophosphoesterase family protein [Terracidiphilus sp.]|jgi:putative phosphoesterase
MRVAIISDIHGNRTAFEAVLADLRQTAPDVVLHGGDLADSGSSPVEIVDRIRELGWHGVVGNTDELLFAPEKLEQFTAQSPLAYQPMFAKIEEMAGWTRGVLGEERLGWLRGLPRIQVLDGIALVHGSRDDAWRAPGVNASNEELEGTYLSLQQPVAVYGHIHRPYVRRTAHITVANTGSVSLSHDGDRRASYLLADEGALTIRRVEYEIARELQRLRQSGLPYAEWIARTLESGSFQMP